MRRVAWRTAAHVRVVCHEDHHAAVAISDGIAVALGVYRVWDLDRQNGNPGESWQMWPDSMNPVSEGDELKSFIDERLRWPGGICMHCGTGLNSTNTSPEHIPSKCLLRKPYPAEMITIEACRKCNKAFSLDEEYLKALLWTVLAGSTDPEKQKTPEVERMLKRSVGLRERIEKSRTQGTTLFGEEGIVVAPEMERVKRVVIKNARGHALYELDRVMSFEADHFFAIPLQVLTPEQRDEFEMTGTKGELRSWSEIGTRLFQRQCGTGQSDMIGPWVIIQDGVYRYAVVDRGRRQSTGAIRNSGITSQHRSIGVATHKVR